MRQGVLFVLDAVAREVANVQPGLVAMHRVENDLQGEERFDNV